MQGSSENDKQSKSKIVSVLIILIIIAVPVMSLVNIYINKNIPFNVYISYERDRCDYVSGYPIGEFVHTYSSITINTQVMLESYEITLGDLNVDSFPLWVDTSYWEEGNDVVIGRHQYSLSLRSNGWRAYREFGDYTDYEVLYYHKEIGVLLETNTDMMHMSSSSMGFTGYYIRLNIQQNNIDLLASKATGRELIINNVLVVGIITQIAIIQWQFKARSRRKKESNDSSVKQGDSSIDSTK